MNRLTLPSQITWMVSRSTKLEIEDGSLVESSGKFEGELPARMRAAILDWFYKNDIRSDYYTYFWQIGETCYNLRLNKSRVEFKFFPESMYA